MIRSTFVFGVVLMLACGAGNRSRSDAGPSDSGADRTPDGGTPDAGRNADAGGDADAGSNADAGANADAGVPALPIVVPPETWTFVPIEGAKCASGTPTGIGIRIKPGATKLFIYLEGGGACASGPNCWDPAAPGGAANVEGYAAAEFAKEDKIKTYSLFETAPGTANPFASMSMVMVPYCTGDGHSGNQVRALDVYGTSRDTYFVGALNLQLALARLAATFPELEEVWLAGTSAGAGGTTFNYTRVRTALQVRVHTVNDSAPGTEDPKDQERWDLWGTIPPCSECLTVSDVRRYNRTIDPGSRFAFLSYRYDATTAGTLSPEEFDAALSATVADIQTDPGSRTFIVDNSDTKFNPKLHVVTTRRMPPALKTAYLQFLTAMVEDDDGWVNVYMPFP